MISFVYFDLGGVIEKDFSKSNKWEDLQKELGIPSEHQQAFHEFFVINERAICTTLPINDVLPILQEKFHAKIPEGYSLLDGFVKRLDKNPSIWPVAEQINNVCSIGILSNMYVDMFDRIKEKGLLPPLDWKIIIESTAVGYIKPDNQIYQLAEEKAGVNPNEILFIDNTEKNIDAAKERGWTTYLYDPSDYEKASKDLSIFWQHLMQSS